MTALLRQPAKPLARRVAAPQLTSVVYKTKSLIPAGHLWEFELSSDNCISKRAKTQVFRTLCKATGRNIIVKRVQIDDEDDFKEMLNEFFFGYTLKHPNLVRSLALIRVQDKALMVMEDGGVALKQFIESASIEERQLPPEFCFRVLKQLLCALCFLHSMRVLHHDIKPANILVAEDGTVKLCDFGLALRLDGDVIESSAGTFGYHAPEVLDSRVVGFASDVWGAGLVLSELMLHFNPFTNSASGERIRYSLVEDRVKNEEMNWKELPRIHSAAVWLLDLCLRKDPIRRPSSQFLLRCFNQLEKIATVPAMTVTPVTDCSAREVCECHGKCQGCAATRVIVSPTAHRTITVTRRNSASENDKRRYLSVLAHGA